MKQKILELIERDDVHELKAYLANCSGKKPLDLTQERALIKRFFVPAVKSYINCFRFSEKAEAEFIVKAPADLRLGYINHHGLYETTQRLVIDNNLLDVANDFLRMRSFFSVDYLLENGSDDLVRNVVKRWPFNNDNEVLKLLMRPNETLFQSYVNKAYFISEDVQKTIVENRLIAAFKTLVYRNYKNFKHKSKKISWETMVKDKLVDVSLPEEVQLMVLESFEPMLVELMLKTTPLLPSAQKMMFERHFDAEWFKFHVTHLYGLGEYRFEPELEEALFKILASKNLDECLINFRQRDDVSFVKNASFEAILKYIKDHWLTDEAQVALIGRGNAEVILKLISRYSPEHGLCWQAEVKLVEIASPQVIEKYVSFHSMCKEALEKLEAKSKEVFDFYYTKHQY